jgi:hypothetical protein
MSEIIQDIDLTKKEKLNEEEWHDLYSSPYVIRVMNSSRIRRVRVGHVTCMEV